MRMDVDYKPEISGQVPAHLLPRLAGIIAAHYVPVFLHEQDIGARWMHGNPVNAVAHLSRRLGDLLGVQAPIDRLPCRSSIVGTEGARSRNADENPARDAGIQKDSV